MNTITVGIIEDTQDIREMWQMLINGSAGYSCEAVYHSAEEAIADKGRSVDVFLVDVNLPGISGIDYIR